MVVKHQQVAELLVLQEAAHQVAVGTVQVAAQDMLLTAIIVVSVPAVQQSSVAVTV
jgi:hypothetical protein